MTVDVQRYEELAQQGRLAEIPAAVHKEAAEAMDPYRSFHEAARLDGQGMPPIAELFHRRQLARAIVTMLRDHYPVDSTNVDAVWLAVYHGDGPKLVALIAPKE